MQNKKTQMALGTAAWVKWTTGGVVAAVLGTGVVNCGGGGGGTGGSGSNLPPGQTLAASAADITPDPANLDAWRLTTAEVERILAQGKQAAQAVGVNGMIAVVDRVGNVLGVLSTDNSDVAGTIRIEGGRGITNSGLEGLSPAISASYFAIAKALTGAYLSSSGNAFSTRTASLIVQEHFYPGETGTPAGPLFGVQFSQLPCGDLVRDVDQHPTAGPKRSPLGLAADPGGFPLYKNGRVVGGVGFIQFGSTYGLDLDPRDTDSDPDERVAWSAGKGFEAPEGIRGNRISGGGVFLLYTDTEGVAVNRTTLTSDEINNGLKAVTGYKNSAALTAGTAYGAAGSGYRPAATSDALGGNLTARNAYVLTNGNNENNRYAPVAGSALSADDVRILLDKAYEIANRGRAQIRTPVGSAIQVTISVVDTDGSVLGMVRTPDAPVFGTDVSLQKARSAMLMSSALSNDQKNLINATTGTNRYIDVAGFEAVTRFDGTLAFSARGLGNYARPFYTDGNDTAGNGPFSLPFARWSPFSTGLQLDLVANQVFGQLVATNRVAPSCAPRNGAVTLPVQNGMQIFPGGFPIYRGDTLIGGIGISGDGIDQDDMISFLGVRNAGAAGASVNHADPRRRIDSVTIGGARARYVQCPFKPFNDTDDTNVCRDL